MLSDKTAFFCQAMVWGEGSAVCGCPLARLGHLCVQDAVHTLAEHPECPSCSRTVAVERASRERAATLLQPPPAARVPLLMGPQAPGG